MEPAPQQITTLQRTDQPNLPSPVRHPPLAPEEIPPGIELVTLPGGVRTLAYTQPATPAPPSTSGARPIPAWAKTTALLAPTVGGGIGAAGVGLSYAAPGLIAVTEALWAAVALIATSAAGVVGLLWAARRRADGPAHVTQNITANGLFGRASGTINH